MDNPWKKYSERTKELPPRELLVQAVEYVKERGRALELGPGALNDSKFLLEQGFKKVTAVNKDALETDPVTQSRAASFPNERWEYVVSPFDAFAFAPNTYDLINAQYALPFNRPQTFDKMFESLVASLKPGGVVTGQFFGPHHEWNDGRATMTFITREHAEKLLHDCEPISFKEVEGPERLATGDQEHWHTFHFIARKK